MKSVLFRWLKTNSAILINSGSLIGTTAITGILGFAYWWVAARAFSPHAVGLASAAISSMLLLGTFCVLGMGTVLIGELPRHPRKEATLISTALLLVGLVGAVCGVIFTLVAPFFSPDFQEFRASIGVVALFAGGVSLTTIVVVLDDALIGLLRGELQFWRNALFASSKLALLFAAGLWLLYKDSLSIYGAWTAGIALSLLPLALLALFRRNWPLKAILPDWQLLRKLKRAALQHHMLNLIVQAPLTAMPLLVTIVLSATINAWFYVAWMITGFVCQAAYALTMVLYAINANQAAELARKMRLTLSLSLVAAITGNLLLWLAGPQILSLFGPTYVEHALWSLRFLALGAFPIIVKDHFIAVSRIQGSMARVIPLVALGSMLELGIAVAGAQVAGLEGLSLGWVVALCLESVFMISTVYRAFYPEKQSLSIREQRERRAIYNTDTVLLDDDEDTVPLNAIVSREKAVKRYQSYVAKMRHL